MHFQQLQPGALGRHLDIGHRELCRAEPGDEVVYAWRSFEAYPIAVTAAGARSVQVPLRADGHHDLDAMAAAITERTRVVMVCTPNNPTGPAVSQAELDAFLARVPAHVVAVVDEAYLEFVRMPDAVDGLATYRAHPNVVLFRTFSKAYGLASLRVGYGLSTAVVADVLNRVRQPFNVNSLALAAALAALQDEAYLIESRRINRQGMQQLEDGCAALGLSWIPSRGNFLAIDLGREAAPVFQALLRAGVIVRPVANYGMPNHLRVTIGLPAENQRFLDVLKQVLSRG
mgnify:CR=1 FL=1